ncbi:MAG TPA: recombinase family protein [Devosia sp.]|jgi:site-specific DNA recombinase|uniref:recombinase family protein n=1 Tax=Devosia sp. TaxID=1871048 RepID=UPI002DDD28CA|nr:recombinase family protein [Devosia sp.]HEV2518026.1 recombinase family protein [Devosia sp.]
MTRAAIYARFSSDLQRDRSIEDQIQVCRDYADRMHFDVVEVYADRAKSGASMHGREGLAQMLADGRQRLFDVVIAETLSRLGRDEGDRAEIRKHMTFAGVKIMTPGDGEVNRLTDGIKALVDAQYLEDLKVMIRRGMAGVTRDGRHAGGRAYGYRPVLGKPGELEIVEDEAEIVRRIYREFVAGSRPREIAARLNTDRIAAPRGSYWSESALQGNKARGHGILVNPLYGGQLVWNRTRFIKDPDTGKRVSRVNPVSEWQRADAPHLAIVDAETVAAVKARNGEIGKAPAWRARAPRRLLSGLLKCGCCGNGMSLKDRRNGRIRIHCTAARQGGCNNKTPVFLDTVEPVVLSGLKDRLKDKASIALYLKTYNAERRALAANSGQQRAKLDQRLAAVQRELDRTVGLVVKGIVSEDEAAVQLPPLRAEKAELEAKLKTVGEPVKVVELHPTAIKEYLATVDQIEAALRTEAGDEHPAVEPIRKLIDRVILTPSANGPLHIRVEGKLNALIGGGQYPAMSLGGIIGSGGGI